MSVQNPKDEIIQLLREKVVLKQDVLEVMHGVFKDLKLILESIHQELHTEILKLRRKIAVDYQERSEYEAVLTIADDTLVFLLHTNVFTFEQHHEIWKNSYVQQNPGNAFCGKIYIYNFLTDSFRFNRGNDVGYLVGRLFVNREKHFFVEGKRQLGVLFNDFPNEVLDRQKLKKIVEHAIHYSMDFDPYSPPYNEMSPVSVRAILESSLQAKIATGKRLGFRFQADKNKVEMP
ncbi:MAG: hypothetical protein DWQ44_09135 [Bacteroidetes bacterium]|nr:MAG: hypothetical protein DWQ33_02640 [Bacteroidota bacterium]REK06452.1 MAG: hypothetical protein DWQ39_02925 [Bacteroidota bacterium]REK33218.1 MAG: hypothetical protein DWQ44_09135 [Bacteroidota bacterium]REK47055.1 MAG: hypothetical protein DWQ48_13470 [Bacteroidota bacterium]